MTPQELKPFHLWGFLYALGLILLFIGMCGAAAH